MLLHEMNHNARLGADGAAKPGAWRASPFWHIRLYFSLLGSVYIALPLFPSSVCTLFHFLA